MVPPVGVEFVKGRRFDPAAIVFRALSGNIGCFDLCSFRIGVVSDFAGAWVLSEFATAVRVGVRTSPV